MIMGLLIIIAFAAAGAVSSSAEPGECMPFENQIRHYNESGGWFST